MFARLLPHGQSCLTKTKASIHFVYIFGLQIAIIIYQFTNYIQINNKPVQYYYIFKMKVRFSTLDIIAILPELKSKICTGWRVNQVFDSDYKTYIFKLNKSIVQMKRDNDPLNVNEETENKMTFIIESGLRIHSTDYDWPRMPAPGQFATKLRKHLRNKRVEDITQAGIDRVIDIRFGSQNLANHLIIELYDRGNLILTDYSYVIIAVLRWRKPDFAERNEKKDKDKKNAKNDKKQAPPLQPLQPEEMEDGFKVGQIYPIDKCRQSRDLPEMTEEKICEFIQAPKPAFANTTAYRKSQKQKQPRDDGKVEVNLKDLFNPHVIYGSSLLEDKLLKQLSNDGNRCTKSTIKIDIDQNGKMDENQVKKYAAIVKRAFDEADMVIKQVQNQEKCPGYIVQKKQVDPTHSIDLNMDKPIGGKKNNAKQDDKEKLTLTTNVDFFPVLTCAERKVEQENQGLMIQEFESFDKCVDVYYTNLTAQKLDSKTFGAEKEARKKLVNLKIAQEKRLEELGKSQKEDEVKAQLIELNFEKVENALLIIRSMLANQLSWSDISAMIKEAQSMNDPIASLITGVNFDRNEFSMKLENPYDDNEDEDKSPVDATINCDNDNVSDKNKAKNKKKNRNLPNNSKFRIVNIDIGLSAHANARKFFDRRRTAVDKERKAIEVSKKAYKNVERRTKEMLKEVVVKTSISKARKRYWFENFGWFISSEGYLVVAGRDAEQNDLLVKRYMKNNDIYVHGDLHGASSVIIKNELNTPIPPKTLNEAGTFAVCNSSAWEAKIVQSSWWVYPNQVSKSAPTGEYLTSGAFIIRGKKNYLPISNLVLGFGFLFRLGEESIERRKSERIRKELQAANTEFDDTNVKDDKLEEDQAGQSDESITSNESDNTPTDDQTENKNESSSHDNEVKSSDKQKVDDELDVDDADEDDEDDDKQSEHRLIDTMTEDPKPDDILLYAIPMCGPYNAFQNFKYKVKVIPGANKRGKATKTSLGMFLHDKRATQREKDLLRALKDQDYARNVPNKVKISAPNLNRDRNKVK